MIIRLATLPVLFTGLFIASACERASDTVSLHGTVWASAESRVFTELTPLHYKYAEKKRTAISPDPDGRFTTTFSFSADDELAWFTSGDFSTPVLLRHGNDLSITQRSAMPEVFDISGYDRNWQNVYNAYASEDLRLVNAIRNERPNFKSGRSDETLQLYRTRIHLAKSHLSDSPYTWYIRRTTGEYLVTRLKAIEQLYAKDQSRADSARQDLLAEAKSLGFFSYASLRAQRAGIRDFTDAWANTFGVRDSLETAYGRSIMIYDVKRLGYERLNLQRQFILNQITEPQALAWSELHLVLERLGEAPFPAAEKSYLLFDSAYRAYPAYTDLAGNLYNDIRRVSPGSPAPDFVLTDTSGVTYSLQNFSGKYLLIDFWAQWCSPCLEEFPPMRQLYSEFNRNELEILAIGIDSDRETWLNSVRSHKNPWIQVYGGKEFENELFKTYRGGGIPFYILIGPDGKILRYNDVRPSFNLEAVLNAALGRSLADIGRL